MAPRSDSDDTTIQVACLKAAEWTDAEISVLLGVSQQAVNKRCMQHRPRIEQVMAFVRTGMARYIEKRIRDMESKADIKARIHKKAYAVVEKALDHGLQDSETAIGPNGEIIERSAVEVGAIHLKAADMGIERVEGKALDRKSIEQRTLTVNVEVDGDKLDSVLRTAERLNQLRSAAYQLPPADVIEADLVGPSN